MGTKPQLTKPKPKPWPMLEAEAKAEGFFKVRKPKPKPASKCLRAGFMKPKPKPASTSYPCLGIFNREVQYISKRSIFWDTLQNTLPAIETI